MYGPNQTQSKYFQFYYSCISSIEHQETYTILSHKINNKLRDKTIISTPRN